MVVDVLRRSEYFAAWQDVGAVMPARCFGELPAGVFAFALQVVGEAFALFPPRLDGDAVALQGAPARRGADVAHVQRGAVGGVVAVAPFDDAPVPSFVVHGAANQADGVGEVVALFFAVVVADPVGAAFAGVVAAFGGGVEVVQPQLFVPVGHFALPR